MSAPDTSPQIPIPRTALQILMEATEFLRENQWSNGDASEARNVDGRPCSATALRAASWTPLGAVKKVCSQGHPLEDYVTPLSWIKLHIRTMYGFDDLYLWNNAPGQNKESILVVMNEVIERVKAATVTAT